MTSKYDVVVIGGSAAGIPTAITARRYYQDKSILVIRKGEKVPIPCGIPYTYRTVDGVYKNIILGHKDTTCLSTVLEHVNKAKDIVIIGGGFIGVEFAEECKKNRNINVTLIEMMPRCLVNASDDEFCDEAEKLLTSQSIQLKMGRKVTACVGEDAVHIDAKSFFADAPSRVKLASTATTQARIAGANLYNTKRLDKGIIGVVSTALNGHAFACAGLTERGIKR